MAKTIADELAKSQREISVAEFFEKNRHLLGFDSKIKAILTCVKEAVDNSLDACEDMVFELRKELSKAKGETAEILKKKIEDSLPDILVDLKYAQREYKILDNKNFDRGFLILRHDHQHVIKIDDVEIRFERDRIHEISIKESGVQIHIEKNNRGEYTIKRDNEDFVTQQVAGNRYLVCVEDNGPGIVEEQMARIFGKLLYGSKFHKLKQSLTADEPLLLEENGEVKLIPIGEFVDRYCEGEQDKDISHLNIKAPCFDWKRCKYSFQNISHAIKHKRANELVHVKTKYGKSIKVTGCHSLFALDNETFKVREVQARNLKPGDFIISPKRIPEPSLQHSIDIIDSLSLGDTKNKRWYVYSNKDFIEKIFSQSKIIHKSKPDDKSRKYYQFKLNNKTLDILEDSYKQYSAKGFLPVWFVKELQLSEQLPTGFLDEAVVKSYYHGKGYIVPVIWPKTAQLMKFLGLFVAEGHVDARQVGLTFGKHEKELVKFVTEFALHHGITTTIEERMENNSIRVKLFGGLFSVLLKNWCGKGAENKKIPSFVFTSDKELRQYFIDYLYIGDGHKVPARNQLMHSTISKQLATQLSYLWLMQGVQSSSHTKRGGSLSVHSKPAFVTTVYGKDINTSSMFSTTKDTKSKRNRFLFLQWLKDQKVGSSKEHVQNYLSLFSQMQENIQYPPHEIHKFMDSKKPGYKLRHLLQNDLLIEQNGQYMLSKQSLSLKQQIQRIQLFMESDLSLTEVKDISIVDEGYDWVYDISVPHGENFIGGTGALSCHNSRGQQGIGISAAVLYGQLTTGKGSKIISKIGEKKPAIEYVIVIDTIKNEPEIISKQIDEGFKRPHGTRIEIEVDGSYLSTGDKSIVEYLRRSSIANPHARFTFIDPDEQKRVFHRTSTDVPRETLEIKPHPHGIEMGIMMRMIKRSQKRTILSFLTTEFTRVGATSAKEMVKQAGLKQSMDPKDLTRYDLEKLIKAMGNVDLMKPPTDCLSPIGHAALKKEIKVEISPEFVTTVTREPAVYRGNPFQIECGLAYGGGIKEAGANVMRFANKVPLMYEKGSCAITQAVSGVDWRRYNLNQPGGSGLPSGPLIIIVHMCSVWMPFRSEAKSAIAGYPIIIKEIKLAIQECARQLGVYLARKSRAKKHAAKISTFVKYSPEVAKAIAGLAEEDESKIKKMIDDMLRKRFGDLNSIGQGNKGKVDEGGEGPAEPDSDGSEPELSDSDESFE